MHGTGQALAGAGGGGFLVAITKEPNMHDALTEVVRAAGARTSASGSVNDDSDDVGGGDPEAQWTVHRATVDLGGLSTWTESA